MNFSLHEYITVLHKKRKLGDYFSGLSFVAKNSKNMAVFTIESWSCSQSVTQPGRQYCHTLPLNISVELIRVYHIEILPLFPSSNISERLLPWKCHVSSVLLKVFTEIQSEFCFVLYGFRRMQYWGRKLILNYFLLH